jgi:hypothetical protein
LFTIDAAGTIHGRIPDDLRQATIDFVQFTRYAGMQYGCLDILRDTTGLFYVIDMNTTPTWGSETEVRIIAHLSAGAEGLRATCA